LAIGEYNATTGATINADFIAGIGGASGLAVSGNTLFVGLNTNITGGGIVGAYNATTGIAINASLITGLNDPVGLAVSDNNLFVASYGFGNGTTVSEYNATTGALIKADFITGLKGPYALAVGSVPEPSAWSMIAVGGVAFLGIMLRKKHRTA